jgi:hypothetical protein
MQSNQEPVSSDAKDQKGYRLSEQNSMKQPVKPEVDGPSVPHHGPGGMQMAYLLPMKGWRLWTTVTMWVVVRPIMTIVFPG